jgi:multiple sugar transport system substrate-binding protein
MSRRKIRGLGAAAGVLSLAAVAACTPGGGDEDEAGGEMVWAIGGSEAQQGGVHQEVARMWSEENPDNPIRIEILPDEADGQREQQALELQAEGSNFDVLGVDVIWTGEYATNGWLESLEDVRGDIESSTIPAVFESALWEDELWAAPFNTNAGIFYYRSDLVQEPPQTVEEMCRMATEIGEREDIGGYTGQGAKYEGFVVNWLELYWGAGGEIYNEDQSEVAWDVETATQVTEFLETAEEEGCLAPGFNTSMEDIAMNQFQSGDAVFMRNWPSFAAVIRDSGTPVADNFEVAPLPEGMTPSSGGFNLAVSAFSDETEAAKDFVLWASTNEEVQKLMATEASLPPVMESVYDDLQDDPMMALLAEVLPQTKGRPPSPQWNQISVEMQNSLFPAYNGDEDPQEAAEQVDDFLEGTIE